MLTSEHTRALRKAGSLCFDTDSDGHGQIRAIIPGTDSEGERTVTIPARDVRVENYGPDEGPWDCFHMAMHVRAMPEIQTLIRRMRKGSDFVLLWTRNNNSELIREAGLVVDELRVRVGTDTSADTFLVYRSVSRDDTARMVRKAFRR